MSADAVRREYAARATDYDRRWAEYVDRSLALVRPFVADVDVGDVLDLCCGTGGLLSRLGAWNVRFSTCVGVDFVPETLLVARAKRPPRSAFAAADVAALPLRSASFDTVVSASAMHYWPEPARALAEVARVLRPRGRLLLLDWVRDPLPMRLLDVGMRLARVPYRRMYSRSEAGALLAGAGLPVGRGMLGSAGGAWRVMILECFRSG